MVLIENDKKISERWINKANSEWKKFIDENRMLIVVESGESVLNFCEDLKFESIEYSQSEEGLRWDSYTLRMFDVFFTANNISEQITSVELLGQGASDWCIDAELNFIDNANKRYELLSGSTFKKVFGIDIKDQFIQKIFKAFRLFDLCEIYERELLEKDKKDKIEESMQFLQNGHIKNVHYSSRELVLIDNKGEKLTFRLDQGYYANHFD